MSDVLDMIDETLTFYSAALGEEITVSSQRLPEPPPEGPDTADDWQWTIDLSVPVGERVPYRELGHLEREEVHRWLTDHGIEHKHTPLDGLLGFDPQVGEWRIRQYRTRNGRPYLDESGEVADVVVRRRELRPLPWRLRTAVELDPS